MTRLVIKISVDAWMADQLLQDLYFCNFVRENSDLKHNKEEDTDMVRLLASCGYFVSGVKMCESGNECR